jgi:hypothetical protein
VQIKGDGGGWSNGLLFYGSSNTFRGGFGALGSGDGLSYLWAGNDYNNAALYLYASNYAVSPGSFRAPIFYDSDNTGYYLNPAEISTTWRMGANYFQSNNDVSVDTPFGIYFSSNLNADYAIYRESGAWSNPYPDLRIGFYTGMKFMAEASYGGMRFYSDTSYATQVMSVNNSADPLGAGNVYVNSNLQAGSSLRAQLFYDSNDTFYYVNPNGNSILYKFENINQRCAYDRAWDNYPSITVFNNTDQGPVGDFRIHGVGGPSGGDFNVRLLVDGDIQTLNALRAGSAAYAPIYYDSNNTGYYWNFADGASSYINTYIVGLAYYHCQFGSGVYSGAVTNPPLQVYSQDGGTAMMSFHRAGSYAINMGLDPDNVLRIGGWSAAANRFQMDGSGNLTMAGNVTAYSDARLKDNVATVANALDLVGQMRGVTYTRKDTGEAGVGVIAQEMLEVLPQVVQQGIGDDDTLSVAYGNLVGVLIEAIKELEARVAELEGK